MSLIFVVNIYIMMWTRYITILNLIAVVVTSVGAFLAFMWLSNSFQHSWMQNVVAEAHQSALFFATVFICISLCSLVDLAFYSWNHIIDTSPANYLRSLALQKEAPSEKQLTLFENLALED